MNSYCMTTRQPKTQFHYPNQFCGHIAVAPTQRETTMSYLSVAQPSNTEAVARINAGLVKVD